MQVIGSDARSAFLTICIPTYNRAKFVDALVDTICIHILNNPDFDVELIVSNNASLDDTAQRLEKFQSIPNFRLITREVHVGSAEENMIGCINYIHGRYVWYVGDDDIINVNSFPEVYKLLQSDEFDCLIFNSPTLHNNGGLRSQRPMAVNSTHLSGSIGQIVESIGILNTFAGITNVIQRRALLSQERGTQWISISKIYSHVAWIVEANKNAKVGFFNTPLVFYRANDYSGHWEAVAKRENVQSLYFWTLGISRLLSALVETGTLNYNQIGLIFETSEDGTRYRLVDDILFKTFQQLEISARTDDPREILTLDQFEELTRFCRRADPMTFYATSTLEIIFDNLKSRGSNNGGSLTQLGTDDGKIAFLEAFNRRQAAGQYISRFSGIWNGYEVYRLPFAVVALWHSKRLELYSALNEVDPQGDGFNVIVSSNITALMDQISAASARRHEDLGSSNNSLMGLNISGLSNPSADAGTIAELNATIAALRASTSWRLTAPIRALSRLVSGR